MFLQYTRICILVYLTFSIAHGSCRKLNGTLVYIPRHHLLLVQSTVHIGNSTALWYSSLYIYISGMGISVD